MGEFLLSIIIPAYNEEATIAVVLEKIAASRLNGLLRKEMIVVDDASTDHTADEVRKFQKANPGINLIIKTHSVNQGKGASIQTGIAAAGGDFILVQDADLEYDPSDYNTLLQPILDNKADIVYGTRFVGGKPHRILFFWHTIGNKLLTFFSNMFSNLNLTDMENGYKLFRSSILKSMELEEKRFGFEPEVTAKAARIPGIRLYEVGISYYGRTYQEGKKINWKDGMKAFYCILKYNLFTPYKSYHTGWLKWMPFASILLFLVAGLVLTFTARGTADEGDSIMHYLFARHAYEYPEHFFNQWAKPLYVFITAPFAQLGFNGIKLFNLFASTLALWLTYKTALKLQIPQAALAPLLAIFAPMLMIVTLSGLTEPMFAAWLILGIYWLINRHFLSAILWLSFLPFIRSEGLIVLCVLLLYLVVKRKFAWIPLLMTGHLVYAVAGYAIHKDLLWIFNTLSYATFSSAYGRGGWLHFVKNLPEVIGIPLCILMITGLLYGTYALAGKYLFRDRRIISDEKLFLVYGIFAACFIGHSAFWALGIFNSFGLLRVLIGVFPLMALICLEGMNALTRFGRIRILQWLLLLAVVIYPFINAKYSFKWKRDFSLRADQEAELKLGDYIKEKYPDYKNYVFYYEACYVSVVLDIDYFDTTRHKRLLNAFNEHSFPEKSFIVWDDWFARVEGRVELKQLQEDGRFEELATAEQKDYWGVTRTVKLFRKK
ncbi:MAG TPA: glycosyltransferase family 2 protein [Chitinophagaceae bacterium]|nr:glycosyltransferase family 2 protein [Chitinophagaceae bacterium]